MKYMVGAKWLHRRVLYRKITNDVKHGIQTHENIWSFSKTAHKAERNTAWCNSAQLSSLWVQCSAGHKASLNRIPQTHSSHAAPYCPIRVRLVLQQSHMDTRAGVKLLPWLWTYLLSQPLIQERLLSLCLSRLAEAVLPYTSPLVTWQREQKRWRLLFHRSVREHRHQWFTEAGDHSSDVRGH